ncbi:MAG TPA: YXWGXW repeat-containing protein [Thermoguttaceae bacterium]|nr:YXWGXW repeat-containing protein [Thermoguttaceae bacterium]
MNVRHDYQWCVAGTLLALGLSFGLSHSLFAQTGPAEAEQGVQVLTRGPVHEAFAETVTFDPEPGIVATKAPPAAIEELPPEQRPEGDNVAWIPGYWGWDDERNDFIWVSGIWRALPPGRQWVPGYWAESQQGFQWTSGYWADAQASEVEYLPEPPTTVEAGPNIAATSVDQTWLPGCWIWQQNRYAWRPGFWANVEPDWVWIPAHYVWAPRGYVFVDGYWDYSVSRRGVLFAPVYFNSSVYAQRGFSYSPTAMINLGVFANHLFLRPRYQHYYFGDYYATSYRGAGYYPRYAYHSNRFGYDPIYAYDRWQNRRDLGWEQRQQVNFQNFRDHENLRPPRTWEAQGLLNASDATARAGLPRVASLLDDVRRSRDNRQRFQAVDPSERQRIGQHAQEVRRFRDERQRLEANAVGAPAETGDRTIAPARVRLPGSPIVAKPVTGLGRNYTPPRTYEAPKLDPNVAAKPRANRSLGQPQQRAVNREPLGQPQTQSQVQGQGLQSRQRTVNRMPLDQMQPQPRAQRQTQQSQRQAEVQRQTQQPLQRTVNREPLEQPQPQTQPQPRSQRQAQQSQRQAEVQRQAQQPLQRTVNRMPVDQPQTQPKAQRQAAQRQPQIQRQAPQPQRQPQVQRQAPQPQRQPQAQRQAPQSQRQPQAQRQTQQRGGNAPAGANQDRSRGKDKR